MTQPVMRLKEIRADPKENVRAVSEASPELVESVKAHGILEPVLVRESDKKLVLGFRRLDAAKKAGLEEIPVRLGNWSDEEFLKLQLAENLPRADLSDLEEAAAICRYVEQRKKVEPDISQEKVANELGLKQPRISRALTLGGAHPHEKKLLDQGRLNASHVTEVLGPLRRSPPKGADPKAWDKAVTQFAYEIARQRLDVDTAKEEAGYVRRRVESLVAQEAESKTREEREAAIKKLLAGVKPDLRKCPKHPNYEGVIVTEVQERKEGLLLTGVCGHRWWATGDQAGQLFYTPAELKEQERAAKEKKTNRAAAKKARKGAPAVVREYAVAFLRAPIEKWAKALQEAAVGAGEALSGVVVDPVRVSMEAKRLPFVKGWSAKALSDMDEDIQSVYFSPVDLPDGHGGKFLTRAQVGSFASSSIKDNVVEDGDGIAAVRKVKKELLAVQQRALGVKQGEDELMPTKVGGFLLGERVTIAKADAASYVGKTAAIIAFDVDTTIRTDRWTSRPDLGAEPAIVPGKAPVAVLGLALSGKRHPVGNLGKLTRWSCPKCEAKAVVQVLDGKDARICLGCGKPEKECSCKAAEEREGKVKR